jgi:rubrerythrin
MQDLVVRIKPRNGKDDITVNEIIKALCPDAVPGVEKWIVQQVEGNSLEAEVLAIAARDIIKKHIVEPLAELPINLMRDISAQWTEFKDKIEPLLQGKFSVCPKCGSPALTGAFCEGEKFICPSCGEKVYWHFVEKEKHPNNGYWVLLVARP